MKSIVEQLNEIYYKHEPWHASRMSEMEASYYHATMMGRGNLMTELFNDRVVAYVEVWRVNEDQLARLQRNAPFCAIEEDVTRGNIAWVANLWIDPAFRGASLLKKLHRRFNLFAQGCDAIGGYYNKKALKPFRIYKTNRMMANIGV